jgi:hypothetical protein
MPKYAANYYTGANVSIFIGSNLVTQVFGISWDLHSSDRPIYGYNSMYFDAVADGRVIVSGQLFLNLTKANYLPTILKRYHQFVSLTEDAQRFGFADDVIDYLQADNNTRPLLRVLRDLMDAPVLVQSEYGERVSHNPEGVTFTSDNPSINSQTFTTDTAQGYDQRLAVMMSDSERIQTLDSALNYIFDNEEVRNDLITVVSGGTLTSSLEYNESGVVFEESTIMPTNRVDSLVERNRHRAIAGQDLMEYARPDQFGNAAQGPTGIDILVQFGPPVGEITQNAAFNYQENTSFILKDARFIGEAGQIMADSQPVMEVYNFLARKKEIVPRTTNTRW